MTTETPSPDDSCTEDIELDLPENKFGGLTTSDGLIKRYGEPIVGIGRQVFEIPDDADEYRYQFGVAAEYYQLEREGADEGNGIGWRSAEKRELREAMRNVADQYSVTRERVRQACTSAYENQDGKLIDQFLEDLQEFQACLNQWYEQNSQ